MNKYVWDNIFLKQDRVHLRMIHRGKDTILNFNLVEGKLCFSISSSFQHGLQLPHKFI